MYPNKEVTILFILLRAGLWEKEPESLSLFPLSGESWENIYRMARPADRYGSCLPWGMSFTR